MAKRRNKSSSAKDSAVISSFVRSWWKVGGVIALLTVILIFQVKDLFVARSFFEESSPSSSSSRQGKYIITSPNDGLFPGELPGYTGWARPASSLAGYFSIVSFSSDRPAIGEEFEITVRCSGHEICMHGTSLFFLRAYGPAIIPGISTYKGNGQYGMKFIPFDAGLYTVEVVLTFSDPPKFDTLPIKVAGDDMAVAYEGFLLPGFPLQVHVIKDAENKHENNDDGLNGQLCPVNVLVDYSSSSSSLLSAPENSAISKARWVVTSKPSGRDIGKNFPNNKITIKGYLTNINSIGIQMDYRFASNCTLLPKQVFMPPPKKGPKEDIHHHINRHPFGLCKKNIHVIFIGDSVMRVQKLMFEEMTNHLRNIRYTYVNIYSGYRRCQKVGPHIGERLKEAQLDSYNTSTVVLFNTGLHDLHRLCGPEWEEDRAAYLDREILESGSFSCTEEYRTIMKDFVKLLEGYSIDLKIFQSSTAAWPKYGNYGIEWNKSGQNFPLSAEVVLYFNSIAYNVLQDHTDDIHIVDGFWITYARPDNREIGEIGKKLAHPGLEVQSAMVRIWSMVILHKLCQ